MSGNGDYGVVRENVLAEARERARTLASQGLPAHEIEHRLDRDLTATERELLWDIARHEVAAVRVQPAQPPPDRTGREAASPERVLAAARDRWHDARRWAADRLGQRRPRLVSTVALVTLAGVVAGLVIGLAVARMGGGTESSHSASTRADRARAGETGRGARPRHRRSRPSPAPQTAPVTPPAAAPEGTAPQAAAATALNDRGFALLNEGRYSEAIPVLRQAVSASNGSGGLTHAYALYNLGHALRLAGRATEAIPVLERRLQIDNQRATVARELKAARRGNHDTGGARPGD